MENQYFYGIRGIKFIRHGEWSDPELIYKKHSFNYWTIEDLFYEIWKGEPEYRTVNLSSQNAIDEAFAKWMKKNGKRVKNYLTYLIENEQEDN